MCKSNTNPYATIGRDYSIGTRSIFIKGPTGTHIHIKGGKLVETNL